MRFPAGCRFGVVIGVSLAFASRPASGTQPTDTTQPVAYRTITVKPDNGVEFDLSKLRARARVVYVSSGAIAFTGRMIDDDLRTVFHFSGADLHPTAIVELARSESVHHVDSVFNAEDNAKLDVYLLSVLPKQPGDLSGGIPLACSIDQTDVARAAIDFAPTSARYVAFRWTRVKSSEVPFNVADVSVLASLPEDRLPFVFPQAEVHLLGETGPDFSNKLGTLADPPTISTISP
ncbi:MAG TPA: hypothetical protein VEI58_03690 [Chthoniobacterales bacterium]|nr:hypothetical protein [Chthoniobacterales bacterium]